MLIITAAPSRTSRSVCVRIQGFPTGCLRICSTVLCKCKAMCRTALIPPYACFQLPRMLLCYMYSRRGLPMGGEALQNSMLGSRLPNTRNRVVWSMLLSCSQLSLSVKAPTASSPHAHVQPKLPLCRLCTCRSSRNKILKQMQITCKAPENQPLVVFLFCLTSGS